MTFQQIFCEKLKEAEIELSSLKMDQFEQYYSMLVETNKVMNLTALTEPLDVAVKHFIDSISVYDKTMHGASLADVGTGAGFPGVVLKIYDPSIQVTLIDSLGKRLNFLNDVIVKLGLKDIVTVHTRAEDAGRDKTLREHFDFVTARAVARLNVLCEYCLPLVKVDGYFIAMKGEAEDEINEAAHALDVLGGKIKTTKNIKLPGLDDKRTLVVIQKIKNTSGKYPRKAGTAVKEPL